MLDPSKDKTVEFMFMQDCLVPIADEPYVNKFKFDVIEASYLVEILIDHITGEDWYVR